MSTIHFQYRAKDATGRILNGTVEAASLSEARQKLRKQSLFIIDLNEVAAAVFPSATAPLASLGGRVRRTDILTLMSQLTIMNQSGLNLAESLKSAAEQSPRQQLKTVLLAVYADVTAGSAFSVALKKHPAIFDESFTAGIAAAERSGTMTAVFERLTYLLRNEIRLRSTISSMLMYPLVLVGVTCGVLNAMIFFVLPQFSKVFIDLGTTPPPITAFLLSVGDFARAHFILLAGSSLAAALGILALRNNCRLRAIWDWLTLNAIVIRGATRSLSTGRSFRLLGTMLQAGVPLLDGLRLCRNAIRNKSFRAMFESLETDVLQGKGLAGVLYNTSFLPIGVAHMVATAEKSGKLGQVLNSVGEYYEEEGERYLRDTIKLLEPAIILALGAVVAGVVLSIVLPLLDVTTMSST